MVIPQSYGGFDPSQNPLGHPSAKLATAWDLMSLAQPAVSRFLSANGDLNGLSRICQPVMNGGLIGLQIYVCVYIYIYTYIYIYISWENNQSIIGGFWIATFDYCK